MALLFADAQMCLLTLFNSRRYDVLYISLYIIPIYLTKEIIKWIKMQLPERIPVTQPHIGGAELKQLRNEGWLLDVVHKVGQDVSKGGVLQICRNIVMDGRTIF